MRFRDFFHKLLNLRLLRLRILGIAIGKRLLLLGILLLLLMLLSILCLRILSARLRILLLTGLRLGLCLCLRLRILCLRLGVLRVSVRILILRIGTVRIIIESSSALSRPLLQHFAHLTVVFGFFCGVGKYPVSLRKVGKLLRGGGVAGIDVGVISFSQKTVRAFNLLFGSRRL